MKKNDIWKRGILLLLTCMLCLLAACEKSGDGKESGEGSFPEQTKASEEPVQVVFAVKSFSKDLYKPFVEYFNQRHTDCQIVLKNDYLKSKVLEKAEAGEGPVLIDSFLIGFEEQKDIWEPLDDLYEREELKGALFENVCELCKIDGVTYGVVLDFEVETCVTMDPVTCEEWTYEFFLNAARERELEAVFMPSDNVDYRAIVVNRFARNFEDSYFIDLEKENYVDEGRLYEVMDIAELRQQVRRSKITDWYQSFQEGKVLCKQVYVGHADSLFYTRKDLGWDISFVGYPGWKGGINYINASPFGIRGSASEEEKRIAKEFILDALSYEGQMNAYRKNQNFTLSIRRDVFQNQIRTQPTYVDLLNELVESARGKQKLPRKLSDAVYDALAYHYENNTSREELVQKLQKSIDQYLKGE